MSDLLSKLSDVQAREMLRRLYAHSDAIRKLIDADAKEILQDVDSEDVAEDVFSVLDSLDTDTLFDRSGASRYGYTTPEEAAYEMFEEELEPFIKQMKRYHELKMFPEECLYCMGMLKGIYLFEMETVSEYKNWAEDVASDVFHVVFDDWRKECGDPSLIEKMREFIRTTCPKWAEIFHDENDAA